LSLALFNRGEFWHGWVMTTITLEIAQQDLPVLVERALAGEKIVIEAAGAAAVRLAPIAPAAHQPVPSGASYRGRGVLEGQLVIGPEFFEPLSGEECGVGSQSGAAW
jgi:antitoxin (DNA-binding transcriptional repressor) of toxin-antitoxin stability system